MKYTNNNQSVFAEGGTGMKKREFDVTLVGCKALIKDSGETFHIDQWPGSGSAYTSTESMTIKEWHDKMPNTIKPGLLDKKDDAEYFFEIDGGGKAKFKKV